MNHRKMKWTLLVLTLLALMVVGGCKKKTVPSAQETTPATTPPQPQPTANLTVRPESIQPGGSATLTWSTTNATNVNIDGIGAVATSGSQSVTPSQSTTYHLTAQGPGGTAEATARLTVAGAPAENLAPPPTTEQPSETEAQLFARSVKDIHFDYDKSDIRAGEDAIVSADTTFLQAHPNMRFTIFGQCDERGSTEYNLALGDRRANTVREALLKAGIRADQIIGVKSSGKECPICSEHTEECWQANRRAHFVLGSMPAGQQCPPQ